MSSAETTTAAATVTVVNRLGLHARPAMALVDAASRFDSEVVVRKGDQSVDGKSIMNVLMLAANEGTQLELAATGPDADEAIEQLAGLFARGFDEE